MTPIQPSPAGSVSAVSAEPFFSRSITGLISSTGIAVPRNRCGE